MKRTHGKHAMIAHGRTSKHGMHTGGVVGGKKTALAGAKHPSNSGRKLTGGKRSYGHGPANMAGGRKSARDSRGGKMGRHAKKMDKSYSRDDFISTAETALGDTEF